MVARRSTGRRAALTTTTSIDAPARYPAQTSLFAAGPVALRPDATFERIELSDGAWVDVSRDWLGGADELCMRLIDEVDWQHHRRWMYDRMVDDPRLTRWYDATDPLPEEALAWFRAAVGRRYGVRFGAVGLNFYRDGQDSVASHADRELRHLDDTLVAIVTLGAARPFLLRRKGGGPSIDVHPASGDLLVMGGTCQAAWEHAVPKVSAGAGPRISASIRWARGAGGAEQAWAPPDSISTDPTGPGAHNGQGNGARPTTGRARPAPAPARKGQSE